MIWIPLLTLILIFIKVNNSNDVNREIAGDQKNKEITPGTSEYISINYQEEYILNFKNKEESDLQINIHSINCNIDVQPKEKIKDSVNLNIYSIIITDNSTISIKPIKDIVDGKPKEKYEIKECPLIINSYYIKNETELEINNKEENVLYLNSDIHALNISYSIKDISNNSFVSLYFKFKETLFLIDISYINSNDETNSLSKNINESTHIYLNRDFLKCNNDNDNENVNGNLSIIINNLDYSNTYIYLKIIEEKTVSLLEKNALNFGFITSKTAYQYYFTEVLEGEEGELMLHNKRNYGILHAKNVNKTDKENNSYNIYNISNYPIGNNSTDELEYDPNYLQLKYNYKNTTNCTNGCYLLITYEQIKSEEEFPLVGYEFTILSRTWSRSDYISSIIDIPFNEYIISCFGKGASRVHYYSIYIPNDADSIMIQIEGDYFDAFYDKGRKKINTLEEDAFSFGIKASQNIISLNSSYTEYLKSQGGFLSLAFRTENYFSSIISSYYFRVLYKKANETKYLPMDSNLGNLCIPEKDNTSANVGYYYCYLILKNNYNESNLNFSVSSTSHNEYVRINITGVFNNNVSFEDLNYFNYVYDKNKSNIDYFLIKFKFQNDQIKNIIISFCDRVNEQYPHIYSAQMFYLNNFTKIYKLNLKNSFLGDYQYISGDSGIPGDIYSYKNFKRKLISFHLKRKMVINITTVTNEFIYYFQFVHNFLRNEIRELEQGKPLVEFTNKSYFPLFYYYKILNKNYINANINYKINDHNESFAKNYPASVFIINEVEIIKRLNGERIETTTPFIGKYSDAYGIGLVQVNKILTEKEKNDTQYLFIVLYNGGEKNVYSPENFFVEIMVNEYDEKNGFFLPQNEYFIDTFDDAEKVIRDANQYSIFNPEGSIQSVIELSSEYSDIKINFINNITYKTDFSTGFQRFIINEEVNETIYFSIISSRKKANYMIIYYLNENFIDRDFNLGQFATKDNFDKNQNLTDVSLEFDGIFVSNYYDDDIIFYISGTLFKENNDIKETINNTCFLLEREKENKYTNKAISIFNKTNEKSSNWTLIFRNIPRNENVVYDLRLQMTASIKNDNSQEEYMAYSKKVDLTDIKQKKKSWLPWGIPVIVVGSIFIIIIIIYFVIKFIKLKKKNVNLQNEMVSLAFSHDVQKNVLIKELQVSANDSDYESTFI